MQFVHASMGISPGWGGAHRLKSIVGRSNALRLLISGERIGVSRGAGQRSESSGDSRSIEMGHQTNGEGIERHSQISLAPLDAVSCGIAEAVVRKGQALSGALDMIRYFLSTRAI